MRQAGEGPASGTRAFECALAAAAALLAADGIRAALGPLYRVLGLLLGN
jgi:hypothetical protein